MLAGVKGQAVGIGYLLQQCVPETERKGHALLLAESSHQPLITLSSNSLNSSLKNQLKFNDLLSQKNTPNMYVSQPSKQIEPEGTGAEGRLAPDKEYFKPQL